MKRRQKQAKWLTIMEREQWAEYYWQRYLTTGSAQALQMCLWYDLLVISQF
jgi:hypothetical protein